MNYKKGLVALAITGALATPLAANAAAELITYGGKGGTAQNGPQTGPNNNGGASQAAVYGITQGPSVNNEHVTVDKIRAGLEVDFDADMDGLLNGSFVGSSRTDVSIGYAANVEIPNEGTFTFEFSNANGGAANGGLSESDIQNLRLVAQVHTAGNPGSAAVNQFVEVGKMINYTAVDGVVNKFVIQIDTDLTRLDGVKFRSRYSQDGDITTVDFVPLGADTQAPSDPLPADIQLFLASSAVNNGDSQGAYNPLTFELATGAVAGDEVHLDITDVRNTAGVPLEALFSGANSHVMTVTDGFRLQIVDQATSTIEVETDRTTFADCETWDETVTTTGADAFLDYVCSTAVGGDRLISRAKVQFDSEADVGLDIDGTNTMSWSLSRADGESLSGVESVMFGSSFDTAANTSGAFTGSGTLSALGLKDGLNNNLEANIDIQADGVDPLFPNAGDVADWVLSGVSISGGTLTSPVAVDVVYGETTTTIGATTYQRSDNESVAENGVTHVWGIDGALFKTPYVYSIPGSAGWSSTIKVTNEFDAEAGIQADIIIAPAGLGVGTNNGSGAAAGLGQTFLGVKLPMMIPAEGQYTFTGTQLIEAINVEYPGANIDESANWHIEATFLVNAPQNFVHAAAQNSSPAGRADSPVLYKTNNSSDGRQWQ
jgi:hypothetical protein